MERSPACAPLCVRAIGLESVPISFRLLHMQPLARSLARGGLVFGLRLLYQNYPAGRAYVLPSCPLVFFPLGGSVCGESHEEKLE